MPRHLTEDDLVAGTLLGNRLAALEAAAGVGGASLPLAGGSMIGPILQPNLPLFQARHNVAISSPNVITAWAFTDFDIGNIFDAALGVFTAPYAGKYFIYVHLVNQAAATACVAQLVKNGVASFAARSGAVSLDPVIINAIVDMDNNETLSLQISSGTTSGPGFGSENIFGAVFLG